MAKTFDFDRKPLSTKGLSPLLLSATVLLSGCGGADETLLQSDNTPPQVSVLPVPLVESTQSIVVMNASARDDKSGVTWQWQQTSGAAVQLQDVDKPVARFATPVVNQRDGQQQLSFMVTATDREGASNSQTIQVDIAPNNQAPQLELAEKVVSDEQSATELNVVASDDKSIVSYQWRQIAGVPVELIGADSAAAQFVTPTVLVTDGIQQLDFEVAVTDSNNVQTLARTQVAVNPVNALPEVTVEKPYVAFGGHVVALKAIASDSDGVIEDYQWRQLSGPQVSWLQTQGPTARFTAPVFDGSAMAEFEVVVSDNETAQARSTFSVQLYNEMFDPSGLVLSPDQVVDEQSPVQIISSLTGDGPLDSVPRQWRQVSGPAVTLSGTDQARLRFTAPVVLANEGEQTLVFELQIFGYEGVLLSAKSNVVVRPVNDAPTATINAVSNAQVSDTVTLSVDAADADGSVAAIQWQQISGPEVTLKDANSSQASFTVPALTESASATFEVAVTDNEMTVTRATKTVFLSTNSVPPSIAVTVLSEVEEQSTVALNVVADDADGIAGYRWTQVSGEAVTILDADKAQASFTAPVVTVDQGAQTLSFKVEVTDNDNLGTSEAFDVVVNPVNSTPEVAAIEHQLVEVGSTVSVVANASDNDGSISTYQWRQLDGTTVTLTNADSATLNFTAPAEDAKLSFELTVTDNESTTTAATATVYVAKDAAQQVILETPAELTPGSGAFTRLKWETVSLNGPVTAVLSQKTGEQTLNIVMDGEGKAHFDAPVVLTEPQAGEAVTYQLLLTVTDSKGNQSSQTIDIAPQYLPSLFKERAVLAEGDAGFENVMFHAMDIDNDGLTDIVNRRQEGWYWLKNLGDDRFDDSRLIRKVREYYQNAVTQDYTQLLDVNGDGKLDALFVEQSVDGKVLKFLPFEGEGFSAAQTIAALEPSYQDFDLDDFRVYALDDKDADRPQLLFGYANQDQGLVQTFRWVDGIYQQAIRQELGSHRFMFTGLQYCDVTGAGAKDVFYVSQIPLTGNRKTTFRLYHLGASDNYQKATLIEQSDHYDLTLQCVDNNHLLGLLREDTKQWVYSNNTYRAQLVDYAGVRGSDYTYNTLLDYNQDGLEDIVNHKVSDGTVYGVYLRNSGSGISYQSAYGDKFPGRHACDVVAWGQDKLPRGVCKLGNNLWLSNHLPLDAEPSAANGKVINFAHPVEFRSLSVNGDALSVTMIGDNGLWQRKQMTVVDGTLVTDRRLDFAPFNQSDFSGSPKMVDWNQDGRLDVVYARKDTLTNYYHIALRLAEGDGFGAEQILDTWTDYELDPLQNDPSTVRLMDVVDVNQDGSHELVVYFPRSDGEGSQHLLTHNRQTGQFEPLSDFRIFLGYSWRPYRYLDIDGDGHQDLLHLDADGIGCYSANYGCGPLQAKLLNGLAFTPPWLTLNDNDHAYVGFDSWDIRGDGKPSLVTRFRDEIGGALRSQWFGSDGQGGLTTKDLPFYLEAMIRLEDDTQLTMINSQVNGQFARYHYDAEMGFPVITDVRPMPDVGDPYHSYKRLFFDVDGDGDDDLLTVTGKIIYINENIAR